MAKSVIPGGLTIARRGRLGVLTAVSADGKPIDFKKLPKAIFNTLPDEVKKAHNAKMKAEAEAKAAAKAAKEAEAKASKTK